RCFVLRLVCLILSYFLLFINLFILIFLVSISTYSVKELSEFRWSTEAKFSEALTFASDYSSSTLYKVRVLEMYKQQLRWFASTPIRNVASFGGNIYTASPISDINPLHMAAGCILSTVKLDSGELIYRKISIADSFFIGYRKTILEENEILLTLFIPFTKKDEYIFAFKQSRRKEDDTALVNAAFSVTLSSDQHVQRCCFAYGGMAPYTKRCVETESFWLGKNFNYTNFFHSLFYLKKDLPLSKGAPGGMIAYRSTLVASFAYKFFLQVLSQAFPTHSTVINEREKSCLKHITHDYEKQKMYGLQHFGRPSSSFNIGYPNKHLAADLHVTGQAIYTEDMPKLQQELYGCLVLSTKPRATLLGMDSSHCKEIPEFVDFVTAKDIQGVNKIGAVRSDEEIFVEKNIFCVGQPLGIVIATTPMAARIAAKKIEISYESLPFILTIEEAIQQNSFFDISPGKKELSICKIRDSRFSSMEALFEALEKETSHSVCIVSGEVFIGGQEHFYLETNAVRVLPSENDEFTVWTSNQNLTKTQSLISTALGIPMNHIVCICKRMGGGFGGKETRAPIIAVYTSIAAQKLKKCIRMQLDRDLDMISTGQRHAFLFR
ncbi:hypothetical protein IE077_003005, partial [Cardiosporidium cionae]